MTLLTNSEDPKEYEAGLLSYMLTLEYSRILTFNKPESFQPLKASQTFQYFEQ